MQTANAMFGRLIGPEKNEGLITFVPNDGPDTGTRLTIPWDTYDHLDLPQVVLVTVETML